MCVHECEFYFFGLKWLEMTLIYSNNEILCASNKLWNVNEYYKKIVVLNDLKNYKKKKFFPCKKNSVMIIIICYYIKEKQNEIFSEQIIRIVLYFDLKIEIIYYLSH